MNHDVLSEATSALRALGAEADEGELTRARLLATLRAKRSRRTLALRCAASLAAVLAGSLAIAAPGLPAALRAVFGGAAEPAPPAPAPLVERHALPLEPKVTASPPDTSEVPPEPAPSATPPPPPRAHAAARASSGPSASPTASSSPSATPDPGHEAYKRAHALHFAQRDAARALAAWDEYLRLAPRGPFATEARYNRALCLVRLGRTADGARALAPFASGAAGGYRQAEARTLLGALGEAP